MDLNQLLVSAVVFVGVFLPIYAVFRFPVPTAPPVNRRIARAVGADRATIFELPGLARVLNLFVAVAGRLNLPKVRADIRQDLDASGNAYGYSVEQYLSLCVLSGLAVAFVAGLGELWLGGGLLLIILPLGAVGGFYVPLILLRGARNRRVIKIAKQLPYTLDLIALVMAAGSSFGEAVQTLIRDDPDEDFNQELQIALSEIEYGSTRATALKNLSQRIPLESLRSVIASVNQAEKLGTPMAAILQVQADMLRTHRGVIAEKKSASASLQILVPSMLIMIAVVIIVFAPMIIRFLNGELF
ncbi:MAG: type II secretion system F family protein [Planctomycetota bacterium]